MGDDVKMEDPRKKAKKKIWKVCKCGTLWFVIGVVMVIVGIALLSKFAQYWSNDDKWERGLAYAGLAFILVGIVIVCVGIFFCAALCVIYQRMTADHGTATMFHCQKYEYGQAPYPQQPPFNPPPPAVDGNAPAVPSAPPANAKSSGPGDVHIEVAEHHKF